MGWWSHSITGIIDSFHWIYDSPNPDLKGLHDKVSSKCYKSNVKLYVSYPKLSNTNFSLRRRFHIVKANLFDSVFKKFWFGLSQLMVNRTSYDFELVFVRLWTRRMKRLGW